MKEATRMNDETPAVQADDRSRNLAQLVYILQAVGFIIGLSWIAAIIVNYLKIDEVRNTWIETHFNWQIRTFWFALAGYVLGFLLMIVKIGWVLWIAVTAWAIYRVVKGWLWLNDRKAMYPELF
jgi:uncharacterized membrane protein